jgi:universal stress protein E
MFRKIIVLAQGADRAQPAVQRALQCAGRQSQIVLLDVVHQPLLDGYMGNTEIYEPLRARVVAERSEQLAALAAALGEHGPGIASKAIWDHPIEEAVGRQARSEGADLVVFAPIDGPGGALSYSEWRIVMACPVPVLVVKSAGEGQYRHIVAAVDPFREHHKPADLDLVVLKLARELQAKTRAKLSAVHCYTPPEYLGIEFVDPASRKLYADGRRAAMENLLNLSGLPAAAARLEAGAPHEVLTRLAEQGEADVVVMGALKRGRVSEWLIGSTTERVLHGGRVDVLTVKPA